MYSYKRMKIANKAKGLKSILAENYWNIFRLRYWRHFESAQGSVSVLDAKIYHGPNIPMARKINHLKRYETYYQVFHSHKQSLPRRLMKICEVLREPL